MQQKEVTKVILQQKTRVHFDTVSFRVEQFNSGHTQLFGRLGTGKQSFVVTLKKKKTFNKMEMPSAAFCNGFFTYAATGPDGVAGG